MNIDISDMRYNTTRLCIRPFVQADFNDVYKYAYKSKQGRRQNEEKNCP